MDSSKVVCSPSMVKAHPGQDVVLSCKVKPPFDLTRETLEWTNGTNGFMHVYRSKSDNYDEQDERFKNRTFLNHQNLKDGIVSLTLTNVTMKDEGAYTFCLRKPDWATCSKVTLTKILQTDNETHDLLGSPKVVCFPSIVQAFPGQNVVLSCRVEPPFDMTNENLEWKHGKENVHVYPSSGDNLEHQYSRFFNRTSLITEYLKDGIASLTLTNFTNQDEGNYTFCLPELLSCSDVTLTERSDLGFGNNAAIVVGVLGVLGVVGRILAFLRSRRWCKDPRHSICGSQNPPEPELQQMESNCPPGDCFRHPGQGQQDLPRGSQSPQSQRAGGQRREGPTQGPAHEGRCINLREFWETPGLSLFFNRRDPQGKPARVPGTHPSSPRRSPEDPAEI